MCSAPLLGCREWLLFPKARQPCGPWSLDKNPLPKLASEGEAPAFRLQQTFMWSIAGLWPAMLHMKAR